MNAFLWLLIIAVLVNAILVGASLDQSIKQLPARHRIGVVAYSEYSKAADLANGVLWYGVLGIGGALITLAAAVVGLLNRPGDGVAVLLWLVIVGTFAHSFTTTRAAPTNFSQRSAAGDQSRLTVIFDQFVRWQTVRVLLQITTLLLVVWVLVAQLQLMAASELSINFNV